MKRLVLCAVGVVAAVVSCTPAAPPPVAAPAPATQTTQPTQATASAAPVAAEALVDHAGDSVETAISVPADAPNEGVDFENNWIWERYRRFRRVRFGVGHAGDRRFDVITVELPDHSEHTVYFDITELWLATLSKHE